MIWQPSITAKDSGFTLLELLVVLAIVGLMVGLLPSLSVGLERARLRSAADLVALTLEQAEQTAVTSGREVSVAFDLTHLTMSVLNGPEERLPPIIEHVAMTLPLSTSDGSSELHFFPDGGASGGLIKLASSHIVETISVNWLTGRINRGG